MGWFRTASDTDIIERFHWRGDSSETVTGADAAHHLEATLALLEERGWSPRRISPFEYTAALEQQTTTEDPEEQELLDELKATDRTSVGAMLRAALRYLIHSIVADAEYEQRQTTVEQARPPLTLSEALYKVEESQDGDPDTRVVAVRCIEAVLRIRVGEPYAFALVDPWTKRRGRTFDEVRDLLVEAAEFARTHGPTA